MNFVFRIMDLFIAFFIIVSGILLVPKLAEISPAWFIVLYSFSILISASSFIFKGITKRFVK